MRYAILCVVLITLFGCGMSKKEEAEFLKNAAIDCPGLATISAKSGVWGNSIEVVCYLPVGSDRKTYFEE